MDKIKAVTFWLAALCAIPSAASAQVTGVGYAFGSPGFVTCGCGESIATLHAGGGGEVRISDTFGVGADVGYLGPFQSLSEGFGMLSVNGSYYVKAPRRDRPMVARSALNASESRKTKPRCSAEGAARVL